MMYMYSATQPCDEHLTSARPDDGTGTAQVPRVPGGLTRRREGEDMHGAVDDNANDVPPQKAPRATATNTLTSHLTALLYCSAAIRSCSLLSSASCVLLDCTEQEQTGAACCSSRRIVRLKSSTPPFRRIAKGLPSKMLSLPTVYRYRYRGFCMSPLIIWQLVLVDSNESLRFEAGRDLMPTNLLNL